MSRQQTNRGENWTPVDFHIQPAAVTRQLRALGRGLQIALLIFGLLLANVTGILLSDHAHATSADMILFWDPANGSVPSGWCLLSGFNGYFPRGASVSDTVANWGTNFAEPDGTGPYTPSISTVTTSAASADTSTTNGSNANGSTSTGVNLPTANNPTVSITADSSTDTTNPEIPAFTNLELMEYGSGSGGSCTGNGIPNTVPSGAIAMFDGTSLPSGWSTVSAATNKVIRIGSSSCGSHCGSDTETNNVTVSGLNGDGTGTTAVSTFLGTAALASNVHTHAPPSAMSCTSGCSPTGSSSCTLVGSAGTTGTSTSTFTCTTAGTTNFNSPMLPPYVAPLLGEAGSATPTLPLDITAMFDNDPGSGWVVLSGGGAYTGAFIRPTTGSANLTPAGQATRPSQTFSANTGAAITASIKSLPLGNTNVDTAAHVHTYTITTSNATNSNIPPYFDIVVAQKVNFTLQSYKWFVDPCPAATTTCGTNNNVTDPWPSGSLDIAAGTGLPATPAGYGPPDSGAQTLLRLRVQILVSGVSLAANNVSFELQYAKTNYDDCVSDPGNWTTVGANGSGTDWTYGTDSVNDNSTLLSDTAPSNGLGSSVLELFSKSTSPSTNPNPASVGNTMEYDWLLQDNVAAGATQYAFRPVQLNPDGSITLLSYYGTATGTQGFNSTCPIAVTRPSTDQLLRHGEFFQTNAAGTTGLGSDQGFEWAD